MEETLYGPWTVTVSGRGSRIKVILTGSDTSDGEYLVAQQPYVVDVTGEEWTVRAEKQPVGTSHWVRNEVQHSSAFDPVNGFTRQIRSIYHGTIPADPGHISLVSRNRIVLDCVTRDPALAPVPAPSPPDFTVPGE